MGKKRRQGSMTPKKTTKNVTEDVVGSEGYESPVADLRRIIRMFNKIKEELNENVQNNSMISREHGSKKTHEETETTE
jgi:hypothetical protein